MSSAIATESDPPRSGATVSRKRLRSGLIVLLTLLLAGALLLSLTVGAAGLELQEVLRGFAGRLGIGVQASALTDAVVWQIRLPRALFGALIGAALGVSGAALQGLFRNPLADPGLIGISAGAALAVVAVIVLGEPLIALLPPGLSLWLLPVAAFGGSLLATTVVYSLSRKEGRPVVATMLLAGIAINAIAGAGTGVLVFLARDDQIRDLTFWSLGSLAAASWQKAGILALPVLFLLLATPLCSRALNALLLGEAEAGHLGFEVERLEKLLVGLVTLAVGASVAFAGTIGFVGLVVPHLIRLCAGPDHRFLLPASALLGASLLVTADTIARTVAAPAEIPIGVVMSLLGGPFFLWLLMRARHTWT